MADYSEEVIKKIWQKAIVQENNNPDVFRHDYAGAWIRRDDYEKQGEFGWTIEEIVPSEQLQSPHNRLTLNNLRQNRNAIRSTVAI